jgi:hypothetical protein
MKKLVSFTVVLMMVLGVLFFSQATQAQTTTTEPTALEVLNNDLASDSLTTTEPGDTRRKRQFFIPAGKEVIRNFYWWKNVSLPEGLTLWRFDSYNNKWDLADPTYMTSLIGTFKLEGAGYDNNFAIEGDVNINLGGILFENMPYEALFSFSKTPVWDRCKLATALRKAHRWHKLPANLFVYNCINTEGYDTSASMYVNLFFPNKVVAVIPTDLSGHLDVERAVFDVEKNNLFLVDKLPHFVIILPPASK